MAVSQANSGMSQSSRRFIFGINVAINVVLAVIVLGFAVWGAGRIGAKFDASSAGANSLSPRTVGLLRDVSENVTITGLYSTVAKELRKHAEKHRAGVADLLDLYETAGRGKVSVAMIDPATQQADVQKLLKRLGDKAAYKDEFKPHIDAITAFPTLSQKIAAFLQGEVTQFDEMAKKDEAVLRVAGVPASKRAFQSTIRALGDLDKDLEELKAAEIPRYGSATKLVKEKLEEIRTAMQQSSDWFATNAPQLMNISTESRNYLAGARERYATLIAEIDGVVQNLNALKPCKLEEVYDGLKSGENILVETASEAVAVSGNDVWSYPTDNRPPAADGDRLVFTGESAVSSAILKLTQKEKTAVVFVRFGGDALLKPDFSKINPMQQQMPQARMGRLNELMMKENFATEEWDVAASPTPPKVEGAKKTIYVVFPPLPPQPSPQNPRPMGLAPEQRTAIQNAVAESGLAMFVAGWMQPQGQMGMFMPRMYEFNDFLKANWGAEVQADYLVLQFTPNPEKPGLWMPAQRGQQAMLVGAPDAMRFTDQEIAAPLQSLPGAFLAASPIKLAKPDSRPAGITLEPIIQTPDKESIWAFNNLQRVSEDFNKKQGTTRHEDDLTGPLVLGVAGKSDKARVVIFGCEDFVNDSMLEAGGLALVGGQLTLASLYPANKDLFINSLHWLTQNSNRIAVGPSQGDVPRLDRLKEDSTATMCRVFLVAILPMLAVVVSLAATWLLRGR